MDVKNIEKIVVVIAQLSSELADGFQVTDLTPLLGLGGVDYKLVIEEAKDFKIAEAAPLVAKLCEVLKLPNASVELKLEGWLKLAVKQAEIIVEAIELAKGPKA